MFQVQEDQEDQPGVTTFFNEMWQKTIKPCLLSAGNRQQTDKQMIDHISRQIGIILNCFPYRERLHFSADVKDGAKSIALRTAGNELLNTERVECHFPALIYYNKSIAHAEKGSEERAIAYANRSMICLQLEQHAECLENIRLARESNCPERLMEKLNMREAKAKKGLLKPNSAAGIPKEDVEELKLSYKSHANVPQVVECLELHRNEEFGRHVVTNRQLKAGDVVIIEKPFATMLRDEFRYLRCTNCFDNNSLTLIPCEGCTVTMYCSEECLSKAHQQYHRYECGILRDMWQFSGNLYKGVVGLRAVATAIALFDHDLAAMKEHLDGLDESKVNAFTMDWRTATPKDIYNTVHVLSTNQALRSRREQSLQIFCATIIHQLMLERTELGAMCATSAENNKLLFDLILRHWQISQVNSTAMHSMLQGPIKVNLQEHGRADFSLLSMLNHSCVANVMRISLDDGRCAVVTINPIAAGEQLFNSYCMSKLCYHHSAAKNYFDAWYQFSCRCDACELVSDCDVSNEDLAIIESIWKQESTLHIVLLLKSYLNAAERRFPSHKLTIHQVKFVRYLLILYCTAPSNVMQFLQN